MTSSPLWGVPGQMISSGIGLDRFLRAIPFALAHYAALVGLAVMCYAVGRKITTRCQYHSTWERAAVCTSLGLGMTAYLIFVLCLAHWLYPTTLLGILGVAAIVCASEVRSLAHEITTSLRIRQKPGRLFGIGIGSLILLLPYSLLGLYPPTEGTSFDALMYHLVVAKLYVQHHGFVFAPNVHFSLFPQLNEMLFTLMLMLFDDIGAQLMSLLMMAVLVVALCAWGRRLFSRTVGYWASAILLGLPTIVWLGSTAYVDIGLTLFATMALYSCWNWLHSRAQQWLILAAIFAGFASGTKYSGLFFLALIAIVILVYGVRHRGYTAVLVFVAIAAAIAAPWYARSVYYTGNPVFPFLSSIFGYGYWSAPEVADYVADVQRTGVGRSAAAFVSLPWRLAFNPNVFRAYYPGPKRFFLLMPLIIPFALVNGRIAFLCVGALSYFIFWFFVSQDIRYLVPAFPLISLSMAAALNSILEWWPPGRRWAHHGVIVGIVCAACMSSSWRLAVNLLRDYGTLPVTHEQREKYLTRYMPAYPAVKLLNSLKGQHCTLFPLGSYTMATMAYFTDGAFIGEDFGLARSARILGELGNGQGFHRDLKALGVSHLLLFGDPGRLREDEFFQNHFKLLYADPPVELYEITRTYNRR